MASKPARVAKSGPRAPGKYGPRKQSAHGDRNWVERRYAGGKMGPMAPDQSDRLFNDSGRMAASIASTAKDGGFTVNVAANRLSADTGAMTKIIARLVELVPEFGNAALLMDDLTVRRAVQQSIEAMVQKAGDRNAELRAKAWSAGIGLAKSVVGGLLRFGT